MTSVGQARGGATNRYSDEDSYNMAHASVGYVVDADLKAMQNLANNRSLRGTYQHPGWQLMLDPQQPTPSGPAWAQTTRPG